MFWICSIWLLQIDVNGKNTAPVYKLWKSEKGGYFGVTIKWNFTKSLVNKVGKVVERCAPTTSPLKIEVRSFVFLLQHLSLKNFCELHLTFLHSILQKDIQNLLGSSQGTRFDGYTWESSCISAASKHWFLFSSVTQDFDKRTLEPGQRFLKKLPACNH